MKSLFLFISAIIIIIALVIRLAIIDSFVELALGSSVIFLLGVYMLFLMAENNILNIVYFDKLKKCGEKHNRILHYFVVIIGLWSMEALFLFYTPENPILNGLRIFLMFFFAIGSIMLLTQLIKNK